MWKIHRYYLKEVGFSAVLTFTVLFGIVLISLVYRGIQRAQGFGLIDAMKVTFYWTADTIPHLLPISLLFATVLTFARAGQDREITAIRSAGVSPRVAMTSPLLVGIVFSLFGAFALHWAVPKAHYEKYNVLSSTIRAVMLRTGMLGDKLNFDGFIMTWEGKKENRWQDVVIHLRKDSDKFEQLGGEGIMFADEASIELSKDKETLTLVLHGFKRPGSTHVFVNENPRVSINTRAIAEGRRRSESDKDLTTDQLLAEVYRGVHRKPGGAQYTVHRRSCFALLPCLFAPLGFCIGVLTRERGRMLALVFAIVPVFLFYLSDVLGAKLIGVWDFPLLGWLPAAVLVVLGTPFCWRLLRF